MVDLPTERRAELPIGGAQRGDRNQNNGGHTAKFCDEFDCQSVKSIIWTLQTLALRSRTPGPPPFSSMNSIPADSNARRTARSFATVRVVAASASSARRIVVIPNAVA